MIRKELAHAGRGRRNGESQPMLGGAGGVPCWEGQEKSHAGRGRRRIPLLGGAGGGVPCWEGQEESHAGRMDKGVRVCLRYGRRREGTCLTVLG